ncbi:MAG: dethiobiotin synthase [Gemmatimonadota bacterium]
MSTRTDFSTPAGPAPTALPGLAVTSITPDDATAQAAAMLIVLLAADGANVAAMVPVETGLDDPCEPGSRGALVRWAAGHLDDPRQVTPFALEADRSAMHAADASGTLLHGAAFEAARDALSDGRSVLVVADASGVLDPVTPSLTMLDLIARWSLGTVIVEPVQRWTVGHVRLLASVLQGRGVSVSGVMLSPADEDAAADAVTAIQDTLSALLDCPVVVMPRVTSVHDRAELLAAARACGLQRITVRIAPREAPTPTEPTAA